MKKDRNRQIILAIALAAGIIAAFTTRWAFSLKDGEIAKAKKTISAILRCLPPVCAGKLSRPHRIAI